MSKAQGKFDFSVHHPFKKFRPFQIQFSVSYWFISSYCKQYITFFRQIKFLKLGPLLVELHLQLLFELQEVGSILLLLGRALLQNSCQNNT